MKLHFSVARWATLLAIAFFAAPDLAKGQTKLSIQGILKQNDGSAVDNGLYDLTFKLYSVASGGTALWSETQMGLKVTGGIYTAQLGAVTPLTVPFDQPYFLGVTLAGEEMSPRTALTAAPYALALSGASNEFPGSGNVGINTLDPTTSLDANGSISTATITTSAAAYTVLAADHVVFLDLAGAQAVTLPSAVTFPRREIVLINKTSTAKTVSSYVDLAGASATAIPANGMIELRSNGTEWRLATSYTQPASVGKAFVRLNKASQTAAQVSAPNLALLTYNEISDAQNCWNTTNNTFTAPRTGIYQISGAFEFKSNLVAGYITLSDLANAFYVPYQILVDQVSSFSFSRSMTAGETFQLKMQTHNGPMVFAGGNGAYLTIMEY